MHDWNVASDVAGIHRQWSTTAAIQTEPLDPQQVNNIQGVESQRKRKAHRPERSGRNRFDENSKKMTQIRVCACSLVMPGACTGTIIEMHSTRADDQHIWVDLQRHWWMLHTAKVHRCLDGRLTMVFSTIPLTIPTHKRTCHEVICSCAESCQRAEAK